MCQFETPPFIYYSYISVILIASISAFSILLKNPKHSLNRNAFLFLSVIALWTIGDLVQWTTRDPQISEFFLRLSNLEDFFYLFFLYFAYDLVGKSLSGKRKLIFALPAIVTAILVAGNFGMAHVEPIYCDYDFGWIILYSLPINFIYSIWATSILLNKYQYPLVFYKTKLQIRVLIPAIIFFVLWSIAYEARDGFNIIVEIYENISPYFILGNLFFLAMMAFAIIDYDLFDFDTIPRKWFAFATLSIIFFGMFLLSLTPTFYFFLLAFYIMVIWLFWGK